MGQLIDGKTIARKIEERTAKRVALLKEKGIAPKLAVILVGEDKPSQTYVRRKSEAAKRVGIDFALHSFPADIGKEELIEAVKGIQRLESLSGLIIQLPLPEPLYTTEVLNVIRPDIDVDCLTDINQGKLVMRTNILTPPTPAAVTIVIKELISDDLEGKNVTIVGAGALVGKPLAIMLMNARATVSVCNSATRDIKERCLAADIIISGAGKKNIVRGDMIPPGAIVIDTGVSFEEGKMCGDVNVEEALAKASFVTPTPGGIGPITVARLLWNTMKCAEKKFSL